MNRIYPTTAIMLVLFAGCDKEATAPTEAKLDSPATTKATESSADNSQTIADTQTAANSKPTKLFDASTFNGWDGDLEVFRIEDGAIVGGTLNQKVAHNEFLTTSQEYSDFELRLKFMLKGENTNAGVQIRSRRIDDPPHEMIGYQADLGQTYWGCLYDESRRRKVLAGPDKEELKTVLKRDDWNDYRIRCEGKRIQLWINGLQTVDYTEDDDSIEQTGLIGLQIHGGPPGEAWYKDIEIEELRTE
ncbi:MAG: DUF1080 domain-containing protein [Planctomycetaceae bacterium]